MKVVGALLEVLGSLGVFIFGMKLMSEALQKVAGERLKSLLGRITGNRFKGVVTGFTVTTLIQSSSATTVMVVGFVSAGLLTLTQSIGVVMGANIGTTVTGWLVALLGFKVKITAFALPAIGIGFGMTFLRGAKPKQWGEVLLGFGLLFLGLALLKDCVPDVSAASLAGIEAMAGRGVLSTLIFVAIGTVLTVVLQSSSATMALTLTLTAMGQIPYTVAAAMILGENIGTTATANIAAVGTSAAARRTARAHFVFNIFGVVWAIALMNWVMLPVIDAIVPGDPSGLDPTVVTSHLAAFHTLFNITNTALLLPFVPKLAALVTRWVPDDKPKNTPVVTRFISTALVQTPELQMAQARQEMGRMSQVVNEMYGNALTILTHPDQSMGELVEGTLERETIVDGLESEITELLSRVARAATSASASRHIGEMALNTHRLERIGDHCEKLVFLAMRNHESKRGKMDETAIADIIELAQLVEKALVNLKEYLLGNIDVALATELEGQIDEKRDKLRKSHIKRIRKMKEEVVPGLTFLDALHHLEEIGDRAYGIIMRAEETKQL